MISAYIVGELKRKRRMMNGVRKQGLPVRMAHPITLLAEAYREANGRSS